MAEIRKDFRYKIIRGFYNPPELNLLQNYCSGLLDTPFNIPNQRLESSFSIAFSYDNLMETFLRIKKPLVEKETKLNLCETYSYWRWYGYTSELKNHSDRPACEISVTACINKTHNWPLIINKKQVEIEIGDGLLYLGTEDDHSRKGIYTGDGLAQVFMHYIDINGPFTHHAKDDYRISYEKQWAPGDKQLLKNLKEKNGKQKKRN